MTGEKRRQFNTILERAISEGLNLLGVSAADSIIFDMRRRAGLKLGALELETFDKYLAQLFSGGAIVLKRMILKKLYAETGIEFKERNGWRFSQYVKLAEKRWKGAKRAR